ncbi:tol-pal system protein YbgF [Marinobacterium lutimaris]|uniref:Cell division coordinator CpoB n=1 Tax=Marinobacterium lutimaris TaxID=568106 RepID=A0A1H5WQA2_9GAMM|nr:tol-pal system protein YbgF [Marinobacterium lutimaris]SEG01548.1 tol-pal system protein YbgF [Marinobacterium lutimaris]
MLSLRRKVLPLLTLSLAAGSAVAAEVTQIPVTEVRSGAGMQQGLQSGQSQLLMMVQQLQEEVRQLRGQVETQQYQINKMKQEQLDRYRDTDRRLSAIISATAGAGGAAMVAPTSSEGSGAAAEAPAEAAATAPQTSADSASMASSGNAQEAYQSAFQLVRERKFAESQSAFEAFINDYPDSDHVANAYYWIGEIQLAQQSLDEAQASFNHVVNDYPRHVKVPDALYKLGVVQDRLGKKESAQGAFQRLIQDYPQSSAAGLARNYLQ